MKKLVLILLSALAIQTTAGQEIRKFSTFQLGFIPPLSTNGREAKQYTNLVSLNILAGISSNELGFSVSGLGSLVGNDVAGVHLSGICNLVLGDGRGVLAAGILNGVGGDFRGLQAGGVFNVAFNLNGVQCAGLANWSDNMRGVQAAGIVNIASGSEGVQLAGIANISGKVRGLQISGIANSAGDVEGVQIGSIYNKARNVRGVQIGLVNIARDNDCPIGLVNIIRKGEMAVGLNYNELQNFTATFRSGGKVMYGILGGGINFRDKSRYVVEGGIGAHINCTSWFRINNELKTASLSNFSTESVMTASYALLPAFRIAGRVELFGGPTLNFMNGKHADVSGVIPAKTLWRQSAGERTSAFYIGYTFGLQFVFHR